MTWIAVIKSVAIWFKVSHSTNLYTDWEQEKKKQQKKLNNQ